MHNLVILDEKVIEETANFKVVKRWIKGSHPTLGTLQIGWSKGVETIVESTIIKAIRTFEVVCDHGESFSEKDSP